MLEKNDLNNPLWKLEKSWVTLFIWFIVVLILFQIGGIIIHELGHYSSGKIFGCENLSISISKFSWQDSFSNVTGWESCSSTLVVAEDGSRICNTKTNIISFAGFFLSILFFIPFLIIANGYVKIKFKKFFLSRNHLILILIFIFIMALKSASFDFFKIFECLVDTSFGDQIFRLINILQIVVMPLLVLAFMSFDFWMFLKKH